MCSAVQEKKTYERVFCSVLISSALCLCSSLHMLGICHRQVLFNNTPRISAANSFTNLKAWKAIYDNYVNYKAVCLCTFLLYCLRLLTKRGSGRRTAKGSNIYQYQYGNIKKKHVRRKCDFGFAHKEFLSYQGKRWKQYSWSVSCRRFHSWNGHESSSLFHHPYCFISWKYLSYSGYSKKQATTKIDQLLCF